MRAVILRSLGVIGIGAVLLAGLLYVASTVDARAPEVLGISVTQPVAGDAETALITTSIEIAFSEPVDPSAAAAVTVEPAIEGTASWSGSTLIFTPSDPLELEATYTVRVDGDVHDPAGNEMSEQPPAFTFTTAGRPTVVETTPAADAVDVALEEPISIRFSSLMDTASIEARLELRPTFRHELRWSGEVLEIVPMEPLAPNREYRVVVEEGAVDVAGVELDTFSLAFRTVAPGLAVEALVPADGVDGVAPATAIAIVFDRPIDPATVATDGFVVTPAVAGSLEVVVLPDDPPTEDGAGRVLRFQPSGPLPATTTFEVALAPGIASADGGELAAEVTWTFTTGAPPTTISNQVTFVTDRGGVANVWTMNPDGTGQRQLSSELVPIVDYAVAPDGSSLVVADGRRLVFLRADGSERRVLTDATHLEFDPSYAPDGDLIAFGRADADTGEGLGLWTWAIGGGAAEPIPLPADDEATPSPSPSHGGAAALLRAPRWSPDGRALAFVDAAGAVAVLDLDEQRLTRVTVAAVTPPAWLPDATGVLVASGGAGPTATVDTPVLPLDGLVDGDNPAPAELGFLSRHGATVEATGLGEGTILALASDGRIAVVDGRGTLRIADGLDDDGEPVDLDGARVTGAAFAPGEAALVVVTGDDPGAGRIERLDPTTGRRTSLAPQGGRPRWLP